MRYYPAFLDLSGRRCLVCGVGAVGMRKLRTLLECGPGSVLALDASPPSDEMASLLADHPELSFDTRPFREDDLSAVFLVIAATSDSDLNRRIADSCADRSILCNVADDPDAGSFIVPAHLDEDGLTLCVSTHGASPALSRRIRQDLQVHFGSRYTGLVTFMGRVRPLVLALDLPQKENMALFRALVDSQLADALHIGDADVAREIVRGLLPQSLHPRIGELLDGIC